MSLSLAVKYRPKKWEDVVEQDSIKIILQNQLDTGEIKNSYLFVGGAGTGKTTSARIFANELNKGMGNPIELDAASNNSVDDMRDLIKQAQSKSLDSEYKCFIIDECFSGDTLVKTINGNKRIDEITTSDIVYNMGGISNVTNVFKNSVLTNRLCCVKVNNRNIFTTVDHLFFTNNGWVKAKDLIKGDIVYESENLFELWERVFHTKQSQKCKVLLSSLFSGVSNENTYTKDKNSEMHNLWQGNDCTKFIKEKNLFKGVYGETNFKVRKDKCEYRIWDGVTETVIRKNETKQSIHESRYNEEDFTNKRAKRNITSVDGREGWKWEIYNSTDDLMESIRRWMDIGISNTDRMQAKRTSISYELQSRPCLSSNENCSRGGWQKSQMEKWTCKGCEENRMSKQLRVDSVEVYKRGYNDELFRSSFSDKELSSGIVTLYDLEVAGNNNYFANDILVHNCHMITVQGWNALLKLIEEPPAKSIFIFCTTNPEKIPKTILSRVQRYDFKMISQKGIMQRLTHILHKEDIPEVEGGLEAVEFIAKLADGHLRDSLTMLDKCLAYSTNLTLENVVKALGTTDYETMFDLLEYLLHLEIKQAIMKIEEIHNTGKDLKLFVHTFVGFLLDMCKLSIDCGWRYVSIPHLKEYEKIIDSFTDSDWSRVSLLLKEFMKLDTNIKYSATPKIDVECAVIGVC